MQARGQGFSLVELAVVISIVAFLMGGLMYTLSAQTEQRSFEETRRRLEQARELVLAFAITNGRLPCPARGAATAAPATEPGYEVLNTTTGCIGDGVTDYYGGASGGVTLGLLPARSIGYQQVDSSGLAVDAWGNRIRYAVAGTVESGSCGAASPTSPYFVHTQNLKNNGVSCRPDDLLICKSATGISANNCGGEGNQIMTQKMVVAIIFSTGKNGASGGTGADEAANLNGGGNADPIFVFHAPASDTATNGEFDDQFTWITVGELYGKLIAAGRLP
jgi:prepilin-type N-terminal cleavage/methylation domain-containing protein